MSDAAGRYRNEVDADDDGWTRQLRTRMFNELLNC